MTIWSPLGSGTTIFTTQFEYENQVRYPKIRSLSKDFSLLSFYYYYYYYYYYYNSASTFHVLR